MKTCACSARLEALRGVSTQLLLGRFSFAMLVVPPSCDLPANREAQVSTHLRCRRACLTCQPKERQVLGL